MFAKNSLQAKSEISRGSFSGRLTCPRNDNVLIISLTAISSKKYIFFKSYTEINDCICNDVVLLLNMLLVFFGCWLIEYFTIPII